MKAHTASLINALLLLSMSLWGYLGSATPSVTALIPGAVGVILLAVNSGVRKQKKMQAHVAVVFTFLIALTLAWPLVNLMKGGNTMATIRVAVMEASSLFALVFFIKSFIDARKARNAAS